MSTNNEGAEVIVRKPLAIQVCVPDNWTDEQVTEFANRDCLCGTTNGWQIRKDGPGPERVKCEEREGFTHLILIA